MDLKIFSQVKFLPALKALFKRLKVPMNYVADEPTTGQEILKETYKENESFQLMEDVYFVGMVDDAAFEDNKSLDVEKIKSDYDGILIFGVKLKNRPNGLLPTRSQLAEISRAFNREFYYTPVVVVFKYGDYLAFANTERLKYKQEWREGEKAGKVSLLRDINIEYPHSGHERILAELEIPTIGTKKVDSFDKLYTYWQEVFSVSLLNKKFYQELSNWYFWARDEVRFPNEPLRIDYETNEKYDEAINEHNGKNVIRLLTRILFVWFIKEKGLIPNEIFDENFIVENLIEDFEPQKPQGIFATGKHTSKYYRAILQNLFFATLNCEKGKRQFRRDGDHQNVTYLMRYQTYFKNPDLFLEIMENKVPFMNGGLFDCLDKVHPDKKGKRGGDIIIYQDGFSDKESNVVSVPDYLFFDRDEIVDLSKAYGQKKYKKVNTKGLLKILESYKFTITENTPIEEDVALDPELLGRVFENLLASYNPETKTTARKQTGSFYTPREIVNYMVDESLIAYLKNAIPVDTWGITDNEIDAQLRDLMSFESKILFPGTNELKKDLIKAIDNCKILDPACGSGAFPMGVLQKMVHVLHKIDPNNEEWQQRQLDRIDEAVESLDQIEDAEYRDRSIKELKEQKKDIKRAFENNELDYGRKLYLIENCIYGVDIQSIAVQISKLRFFISLIVDQHIDNDHENFGIRPLPNLETKFVAANSLIGISKPGGQSSVFDNEEVKELEQKIKSLNKKLFSIKSPSRKREIREEMKTTRNQMTEILEDDGLDNKTARNLAKWDPFDQNASSPFFDPEWMFDISDGFDVVIGNPPYGVSIKGDDRKKVLKFLNKVPDFEIYYFFIEIARKILSNNGILSYIIPNTYLFNVFAENYRNELIDNWGVKLIIDFTNYSLFDTATIRNSVFVLIKGAETNNVNYLSTENDKLTLREFIHQNLETLNVSLLKEFSQNWALAFKLPQNKINAIASIKKNSKPLYYYFPDISQGLIAYDKYRGQSQDIIDSRAHHYDFYKEGLKKWMWGEDIRKYTVNWNGKEYIEYGNGIANPRQPKYFQGKRMLIREITNPSIFAAITEDELYNDPAILIVLDSEYCLEAITMILNSCVGTFFHFNASPKATKGDFPKILVKDIKEFPTPSAFDGLNKYLWSEFYKIVSFNVEKQLNIIELFLVVDAICLNLYFPDHMKERAIDVLKFVEEDIEDVMEGKKFEYLNDKEKKEVIELLQEKWSHPDNEVRNRIKLFAVRSPEILKPILEG